MRIIEIINTTNNIKDDDYYCVDNASDGTSKISGESLKNKTKENVRDETDNVYKSSSNGFQWQFQGVYSSDNPTYPTAGKFLIVDTGSAFSIRVYKSCVEDIDISSIGSLFTGMLCNDIIMLRGISHNDKDFIFCGKMKSCSFATPYNSYLLEFNYSDYANTISALSVGKYFSVERYDNNKLKHISINICDSDTDLAVADGKIGVMIPPDLNQSYLRKVAVACTTKAPSGAIGTTTFQLRRSRAGSESDVLTTALELVKDNYTGDVDDFVSAQVLSGDILFVDVDSVNSTAPKGVNVTITLEQWK